MTVVQLSVCGVLCMGFGATIHGLPAYPAGADALPEMPFMGLTLKGLAYMLMAISQQYISANCAEVLVSAEAVFGAMIAALLLGETLGFMRGVGSLCIVIAVIIAARIPASST